MTSVRASVSFMCSTVCCLLIALLLSGCVWPSDPLREPLPLFVFREDGAFLMQFPVCEGDALSRAGVSLGEESGETRAAVTSRGGREEVNAVVTLQVTNETIQTGELGAGQPVLEHPSRSSVYSVSDVSSFFAITIASEAAVDRATLDQLGGNAWIVRGVEGGTEASVSVVTSAEGMAVVADYCGAVQ